jgi:hypothetical protein
MSRFAVLDRALDLAEVAAKDVKNVAPKRQHTRYLPRLVALDWVFKIFRKIPNHGMERGLMPQIAAKSGVALRTIEKWRAKLVADPTWRLYEKKKMGHRAFTDEQAYLAEFPQICEKIPVVPTQNRTIDSDTTEVSPR